MLLSLKAFGVLIIRVAIALGAVSLSMPEMAFAETQEKDHWESTKLNDADFKQIVNTKNCYVNENNFIGCIEAINSLLRSSTPAFTLSNKKIETLAEMKAIVKSFEKLQIRKFEQIESEAKSFPAYWKEFSKKKAFVDKSWRDVYKLSKAKPVSFEYLSVFALTITAKEYRKASLANAINAFLNNSVDPHTYLMTTSKWNEATAKSEEQIVGAGIQLHFMDNQIVLMPFEDSAAEKAGVQNLDVLIEVNGTSVVGMNPAQTSEVIRGKENTTVQIAVLRNGERLEFKILRTKYSIKNVDSKMIVDPITKRKIGYIKVASFMEAGVCQKFYENAKALRSKGAEALVLDLRNNGGGLLNEALCMATLYLEKGQVVLTQNDPTTNKIQERHIDNEEALLFDLYNKKPLVILQNAGSASASEVLAGSLSVYGRAITVGERSFGKGTVQEQFHVKSGNGESGLILMQTISRFHFANGTSNQLLGINPDIAVYAKPNPSEDDKFAIREADRYSNAIAPSKPLSGFPSVGTEAIKRCVQSRSATAAKYRIDILAKAKFDHQLFMTREVASCLMGR